MSLGIPGVYLLREYRRYYPNGEVTGHLLGFTNLDDAARKASSSPTTTGSRASDGAKRVIQDRRGRVVENVEIAEARREPGEDLVTSIDLRIQYLAYRELKAALREHRARAGSVVVLDVRPAKCWRWSTSRRSTRTTATQSRSRATATAP